MQNIYFIRLKFLPRNLVHYTVMCMTVNGPYKCPYKRPKSELLSWNSRNHAKFFLHTAKNSAQKLSTLYCRVDDPLRANHTSVQCTKNLARFRSRMKHMFLRFSVFPGKGQNLWPKSGYLYGCENRALMTIHAFLQHTKNLARFRSRMKQMYFRGWVCVQISSESEYPSKFLSAIYLYVTVDLLLYESKPIDKRELSGLCTISRSLFNAHNILRRCWIPHQDQHEVSRRRIQNTRSFQDWPPVEAKDQINPFIC